MQRLLRFLWALCLVATLGLPLGSRAATVTYFHNDQSGTPVVATSQAGSIVWRETYHPYGSKLLGTATSAQSTIGFHGKPFDDSTALSYMGGRYYDPYIGRFLGVDPQGVNPEKHTSFNRYAYANNNPYRFVDPDGHTPLDVFFLVFDLGKLGFALYTGVGIASASADVVVSAVGVVSPIPGLRLLRTAEKGVEANRVAGRAREIATERELVQQYGEAAVQREQYLRDAVGKIVKDPVTGKARRIDHVVIKDGKAVRSVETTSETASKTMQSAQEGRVRDEGATFVRDRTTGKPCP